MNILHISPYFPDMETNHAGGICMGKELDTLRKKHSVYVLTFISQKFDRHLAEKHSADNRYETVLINKFTRFVHAIIEFWMPYYFAVRTSLRFSLKLIRLVKKYKIDAIHAEYASMGQYLWIKKLFPNIKFNLIEHDITAQAYERKRDSSKGLKRIFFNNQYKKVLRKEGKYIKLADNVLTFNEKDKNLINNYYGREDVLVINTYFGDITDENEVNSELNNHNICFVGQMAREENFLAAMRLIDIVVKAKEMIKDICVFIIGNNPPAELVEKAKKYDYITITGFVDDVDNYIKNCSLAVFPLQQGAGIKVKVLKSMWLGLPVITTRVGAEGIDEEGNVVTLANDDDDF